MVKHRSFLPLGTILSSVDHSCRLERSGSSLEGRVALEPLLAATTRRSLVLLLKTQIAALLRGLADPVCHLYNSALRAWRCTAIMGLW